MDNGIDPSGDSWAGPNTGHWFDRDDVEVLMYRINRRPIGGDPSLFEPNPDLLADLEAVLAADVAVESGRKHKRQWRLGDVRIDDSERTMRARLGWYRADLKPGNVWDPTARAWIDHLVPREDSAVVPLAFSLKGRVLGVAKHGSFTTEGTVDTVLTKMLNEGERAKSLPLTEWAVEPLGDEQGFYSWLGSIEQLLRLTFVFERPNPDGLAEFQALFDRLDRYEAKSIREEIIARDHRRGLDKSQVTHDPSTRAFIAAAMHAFGRIGARGVREGKRVIYDQRKHVLRRTVDLVGADWDDAIEKVLDAVERVGDEKALDGHKAK